MSPERNLGFREAPWVQRGTMGPERHHRSRKPPWAQRGTMGPERHHIRFCHAPEPGKKMSTGVGPVCSMDWRME